MRSQFIKITANSNEPIVVTEVVEKRFSALLHYHPELELTLILEGTGKRFVGDSIEEFQPGDLVLVGENIPHYWCSSPILSEDSCARAIVLQFKKDFLGEDFFKLAGAEHIDRLINDGRGICLKDANAKAIILDKLLKFNHLNTFGKTLLLLEILDLFAKSEVHYLSSPGFKPSLHETELTRMNKVYSYVYHNLGNPLEIAEIAGLLNMSVSTFSHYFKKRAQKTFTQFVNEMRIGLAKRLLIETEKSIAEIAYECGYGSLSNFNKQFNALVNLSPRTFRKGYS
ncbi:AraC family transcriptional regulator [Flavitalea sp. BT771]|uniref:AraC family transcriptional regulator n=1 Tax=Flavitalea sp. BT771 TaxID=3063329 RepID=UPI0026E36C40|nr:AraC family transcriptional regulator [Flavitalea sp. BT771]MDO6432193.1 AraC family transcriptional regulator [Flavitalea sp. BT771]MDV6221103.1 AraC family transcriptional regulator [Flavitalea sp. BT771]